MGRVKSLMIKKAARQLIEGQHNFNESFEHDKKILSNTMPSKPIRNKIAGYIARMIKMQKAGPRVRKKEIGEIPTESYSY